ncbi:MAG: hydantoinase B/oxoprolinase family protein [Bacteroidia bacterium]|nr:hydantoinase B/oxoprolinase family protein [Bacteroidia bacterium]
MWKIAIDTGGTFTDCYGVSPMGMVHRFKVLSASVLRGTIKESKHSDRFFIEHNWPAKTDIFIGFRFRILGTNKEAKVKSIDLATSSILLAQKLHVQKDDLFEITSEEEAPVLATRILTGTSLGSIFPAMKIHIGTTKGTNAILEKSGARTGFIVTKGFRDLLVIDNQQRPDLFQLDIPDRTTYYDCVFEIEERIDASGNVITEIPKNLTERIEAFIQLGKIDSWGICLVNAYVNPIHENKVVSALEKLEQNNVSISHRLSPTIHYLKRAKTTVINAYLHPIVDSYVQNINNSILGSEIYIMKSSGGLVAAESFVAKDSLLSGPAGGVVGTSNMARMIGENRMIAFDMGGTSTDVSRYDGLFDYVDELNIGNTQIKTPAMNIHTVAAGGGSIVDFKNGQITVGPESAGASPGPACYGDGGPLTITDVNLLLGKIPLSDFKIPVQINKSREALAKFKMDIGSGHLDDQTILKGIAQIANEKMAQAIKQISIAKGYDPSDFVLCAFGGAGGLHACAIAEILDMRKIVIPYDAGILSAFGIFCAPLEKIIKRQVLKPLDEAYELLDPWFEKLDTEIHEAFRAEDIHYEGDIIAHHFIHLRLSGQSDTIQCDMLHDDEIIKVFKNRYSNRYGYYPEGSIIEVERIEVVGQIHQDVEFPKHITTESPVLTEINQTIIDHTHIPSGAKICGPAILKHDNSTAYIAHGWNGVSDKYGNVILTRSTEKTNQERIENESIHQALFTNRFSAIAEEMGNQLQRTSFSVNIKERLDFSCAILTPDARLLVNAPHIPVHLGSLGICARLMLEEVSLKPGDVIMTNHPRYGGSHLPDLTMMMGAFDEEDKLIGYLINRAHHAEIGGKLPGSMPPDAQSLSEEGVIFELFNLMKGGVLLESEIINALTTHQYPSRLPDHNIADIKAGVASLEYGKKTLQVLASKYGLKQVHHYMKGLTDLATNAIQQNAIIKSLLDSGTEYHAQEYLDDGHKIRVRIFGEGGRTIFDFEGTSEVHPANLNANLSIVYSAILYVLRLLVQEDIPLNEGFLDNVEIRIPQGSFLNPDFHEDPDKCPAVVGGNTEVSQRLVDTLIKAFGLAACSQGTMNNFLFGNDNFGYYETIAGGVGGGPGFKGRSGSHQHMTNTRITDVEELEHNYPVRLNAFSLRKDSGGDGLWPGGEGVIRDVTFLENVDMTIISQHRIIPPYGMIGGETGKVGEQVVYRKNGQIESIKGISATRMLKGERVVIKTPGGGGYLKKS